MQTRLFSLFKSFKSKKDANISSIRQLVSPFLIKVHPDTLSSVKNVEKQVNGSSLQRFNAFLDELENGCNHGNVSTTIDKHVLLEFYLPFRKGKESKVSFAFRTPIGLMDNSISTQTTNERIREWKKFSNKVIVTVHKVAGLPSPATLPIGDSRYQDSHRFKVSATQQNMARQKMNQEGVFAQLLHEQGCYEMDKKGEMDLVLNEHFSKLREILRDKIIYRGLDKDEEDFGYEALSTVLFEAYGSLDLESPLWNNTMFILCKAEKASIFYFKKRHGIEIPFDIQLEALQEFLQSVHEDLLQQS